MEIGLSHNVEEREADLETKKARRDSHVRYLRSVRITLSPRLSAF